MTTEKINANVTEWQFAARVCETLDDNRAKSIIDDAECEFPLTGDEKTNVLIFCLPLPRIFNMLVHRFKLTRREHIEAVIYRTTQGYISNLDSIVKSGVDVSEYETDKHILTGMAVKWNNPQMLRHLLGIVAQYDTDETCKKLIHLEGLAADLPGVHDQKAILRILMEHKKTLIVPIPDIKSAVQQK